MSARYTGGLVYNAPGGWSGSFGSSSYLSVANTTALNLSGDFTVECWAYIASNVDNCIVGKGGLNWGGADVQGWSLNNSSTSGILACVRGGSAVISLVVGKPSYNAWNHIAMTRSGSTLYGFINGVLLATQTNSNDPTNTRGLNVGVDFNGLYPYTGNISNLRIIKGTCLYTSTFTPPTTRLTAVANTQLLTCAYSTFVDGSSNAFTITNNNSATVSTANPFPTSQLPNPALGGAGNGVYTMSQYAALKAANLWPAFDPFYRNVTLNLHGNGTNAAQNNTFLDSSTNNLAITRNGNTTQGTFAPYNPDWSNYFDGSGDYLQVSSTPFDFSGGADFTLEFFMFIPAGVSYGFIYQNYSTSPGITGQCINAGSDFVGFENWNGGDQSPTFSLSGTTIAGQWNHVAMVRNGSGTNNISLYINGIRVQQGTLTSFTAPAQASTNIGARNYLGYKNYLTGYISNLRVVKGTGAALYSGATITVPTAALTAVPNTVLLMCGANRFVDASSNNYSITRTGDVSVQRFSPFSPTTAYSTSVIGGSGYFDGSGDFLSFATNQTPLLLGNSDFTFEAWVYRSSGTGTATIFCGQSDLNTVAGSGYVFYVSSGSSSDLYIGGTGYGISSPNPSVGVWAHVAWVRTGGVYSTYLNGARVATRSDLGTGAVNNGATTYAPSLGAFSNGGNPLTGYIADARLIKGSGGYNASSSTITIPTAPLTAVSNTSLLLSYTNAAIIDNAMMNDLETVGNAQISTSFKKYGTGSVSFDGSTAYLTVPNPNTVGDLTGQFTVECWVYFNSTSSPSTQSIISKGGGAFSWSSSNGFQYSLIVESGTFYWQWNTGGSFAQISVTPPPAGAWVHIAITYDGTYTRLFFNGVQQGSSTTGAYSPPTTRNLMYVGARLPSGNTYPLNGYIDDLRITRGVARYTGNFTPPTSQVQDQ